MVFKHLHRVHMHFIRDYSIILYLYNRHSYLYFSISLCQWKWNITFQSASCSYVLFSRSGLTLVPASYMEGIDDHRSHTHLFPRGQYIGCFYWKSVRRDRKCLGKTWKSIWVKCLSRSSDSGAHTHSAIIFLTFSLQVQHSLRNMR